MVHYAGLIHTGRRDGTSHLTSGTPSGAGRNEQSSEFQRMVGATEADWLGNLDSNQDKQSQSLLCYRYTIPQELSVVSTA